MKSNVSHGGLKHCLTKSFCWKSLKCTFWETRWELWRNKELIQKSEILFKNLFSRAASLLYSVHRFRHGEVVLGDSDKNFLPLLPLYFPSLFLITLVLLFPTLPIFVIACTFLKAQSHILHFNVQTKLIKLCNNAVIVTKHIRQHTHSDATMVSATAHGLGKVLF